MIDLVCILQKTECSTRCCVYGATHHSCTCVNCDSFLMMLAKRVDICDLAEMRLIMDGNYSKAPITRTGMQVQQYIATYVLPN